MPQVEALQRRQEAVERDLTAIEGKLKDHDVEARRLTTKYTDMSTTIRTKLATAQDHWRKLTSLSTARRQALASAFTFHKFKADLRELEAWVQDMNNKMEATVLANNMTDAQAALQLHQERKAEIARKVADKVAALQRAKAAKDVANRMKSIVDADIARTRKDKAE